MTSSVAHHHHQCFALSGGENGLSLGAQQRARNVVGFPELPSPTSVSHLPSNPLSDEEKQLQFLRSLDSGLNKLKLESSTFPRSKKPNFHTVRFEEDEEEEEDGREGSESACRTMTASEKHASFKGQFHSNSLDKVSSFSLAISKAKGERGCKLQRPAQGVASWRLVGLPHLCV